MQVTIIYGFLGAGKTTLLRGMLPTLASQGRVAVLVNEFGSVGVDGELLSTGQVAVREIASGCICCALLGELAEALQEIHERWAPDRLIIEPTGVAAPRSLEALFANAPVSDFAQVDRVVAVVDAARFLPSREIFAGFYLEQIRAADALVLNKVDRVSPEQVAEIEEALCEVNPRAIVRGTTYARVPTGWLAGGVPRPGPSQREHEHVSDSSSGLTARVVPVTRCSREALEAVLARFDSGAFGEIVRAKGFLETPQGGVHIEYVPGDYSLEDYAGDRRAFVVAGRGVDIQGIQHALNTG